MTTRSDPRSIGAPLLRVGVALGLGIGALAGAATPALADERGYPVSCTFQDHVVRVEMGAALATIRRTAAGLITVNGSGCAYDLAPPDVWNTRSIKVFGGDEPQDVFIDLSNGGFAPGYGNEPGNTDEIEFTVLLGKGSDELRIDGTAGIDRISFGYAPGNIVVIPAINLKAVDTDHDLLYLSVEDVSAWGYGGDDVISGNDPATGTRAWLPLTLRGGNGHDELTGGDGVDHLLAGSGNDILKGGKGNDSLYASDGVEGNDSLYASDGVEGNDSLYGGGGMDACVADPQDVIGANCE